MKTLLFSSYKFLRAREAKCSTFCLLIIRRFYHILASEASLARIKLSEEDKRVFMKEFDRILDYISELNDQRREASPTLAGPRLANIAREDTVKNTSGDDRERLLREVPRKEGEFVAVKKIIAQD